MTTHRLQNNQKLVNRYVILNFHAEGGMQEVYKSYDSALDRVVAIKTPKNGVADRRFKRGAEMGARINHPNVAATFDYFEDMESTFLVEEFIEGKDLGDRFKNHFHYLDPSLAAHVLHHLSRALSEAHRVGICHRDIKPGNIMVSNDPGLTTVKLTDFGIAKLAENEIAVEIELFDKDESTLTTSNTLLGAVPYMAPECWDNWKSAGQPMDVWAIGCVAYQLLSGVTPFGSGRPAIINVVKYQQGAFSVDKPKTFGKHKSVEVLEDALWDIIQSCLIVDPTSRLTSDKLLDILDGLCYAITERFTGTVQIYGQPYPKTGFVDHKNGKSYFFHRSEYFGNVKPEMGQNVNFSYYEGVPNARCAPLLLLK